MEPILYQVQISFILFTLLSYSLCANDTENQISDKTEMLSSNDVLRFKSEIKIWETIFTSLISSCWSAQLQKNQGNTRFLIFEGGTDVALKHVKNDVWLLGQCGDNTSILLHSTMKKTCNVMQLINKKNSSSSVSTKVTDTRFMVNFMSNMLNLFFNSAVKGSDYVNENWNLTIWPGCSFVAGLLAVPNGSETQSSNEIVNATSLKNESERNLKKHHGGGGITDAVLTIICALCGGTTLTILLLFRRVRHCICSICGICRDTERLLSDMD